MSAQQTRFTLLFFLLFLYPVNTIVAMEEGSSRKRSLSFAHKDSASNPKKQKISEEKQEVEAVAPLIIDDKKKALYQAAFNEAPLMVKAIVKLFQKKSPRAKFYNNLLFTGPSGSGKSTLAQAIAYILGRDSTFIAAPSLLAHYRNQTAEHLEAIFKKIESNKEEHVLILDEINALTDDHKSEHSDDANTSKRLWTLLDHIQQQNNGLLVLATTNVTKKMPHQLQSRYEGKIFEINDFNRKQMIQFYLGELKKENVIIDDMIDETYLSEFGEKLNGFSRRRIETLINRALLLFQAYNLDGNQEKLCKEYLEKALKQLLEEEKKYLDYSEHMTDEERRHQESMKLQKELFEQSQQQQRDVLEKNKEHHDQQIIAQHLEHCQLYNKLCELKAYILGDKYYEDDRDNKCYSKNSDHPYDYAGSQQLISRGWFRGFNQGNFICNHSQLTNHQKQQVEAFINQLKLEIKNEIEKRLSEGNRIMEHTNYLKWHFPFLNIDFSKTKKAEEKKSTSWFS